LRAKRLGFRPSAIMALNAFIASSDRPCQKLELKIQMHPQQKISFPIR